MTQFEGKCQNLQMSPTYFYAQLYSFRDIKISILNFYLQKVDQVHGVKFSQITLFDGICQNL